MADLPFCKRLTFTAAYNGKYGILVVTAEEAFRHSSAVHNFGNFFRLHVLLIDKEAKMFFNNISVYEQIMRSKILRKFFITFLGLTLQIGILIQRHVFHKYVVIIINDCDI